MLLRNILNYMPVYMALIILNDFHQPLTMLQKPYSLAVGYMTKYSLRQLMSSASANKHNTPSRYKSILSLLL